MVNGEERVIGVAPAEGGGVVELVLTSSGEIVERTPELIPLGLISEPAFRRAEPLPPGSFKRKIEQQGTIEQRVVEKIKEVTGVTPTREELIAQAQEEELLRRGVRPIEPDISQFRVTRRLLQPEPIQVVGVRPQEEIELEKLRSERERIIERGAERAISGIPDIEGFVRGLPISEAIKERLRSGLRQSGVTDEELNELRTLTVREQLQEALSIIGRQAVGLTIAQEEIKRGRLPVSAVEPLLFTAAAPLSQAIVAVGPSVAPRIVSGIPLGVAERGVKVGPKQVSKETAEFLAVGGIIAGATLAQPPRRPRPQIPEEIRPIELRTPFFGGRKLAARVPIGRGITQEQIMIEPRLSRPRPRARLSLPKPPEPVRPEVQQVGLVFPFRRPRKIKVGQVTETITGPIKKVKERVVINLEVEKKLKEKRTQLIVPTPKTTIREPRDIIPRQALRKREITQIPVTVTRITPKQKQLQKPITKPIQPSVTLPKQVILPKQIIEPRQRQRPKQITVPRQKQIQLTRPITTPLQITRPKQIQKPITKPRVVIEPRQRQELITRPKVLFPKLKEEEDEKPRSVKLLVKSKGKFFKVNGPFTERDAKNIGATLVNESASAQFKLIPTKGKPKQPPFRPSSFSQLENKFREPKKKKGKPGEQTFIEKKKFRIDTPGELRQITAKGILANKIKASKKGAFSAKPKVQKTSKNRRLL